MLMSRHVTDQIDLAFVEAFIHHRYPCLEFSSNKRGTTHAIVIDGFTNQEQLDQFTTELKQRTGVQL